jgi:tRNA modification GTPase
VEARIDFPSDVGEPIDGATLARSCGALAAQIDEWLLGLPSARKREAGLRVVLAGPPNVGKSSLLNALLGYERAIVSAAPGTTRDIVEASLWIDGLELRLTDTAGLHASADPLERMGMERAARALQETDLAVVVLDRSDPEGSLRALARMVDGARAGGNGRDGIGGGENGRGENAHRECDDGESGDGVNSDGENGRNGALRGAAIVAWNKSDLAGVETGPGERDWRGTPLEEARVLGEVGTVAIRPGGAEPLRDAIRGSLPALVGARGADELPTTSVRQEALLAEARASLGRAEAALRGGASCDLVAFDLTDARRALGEIVGRGVDPDVVAAIFSRFCIGK